MNSIGTNNGQLRILAAIATFGEKNLGYLKRMIENFRGMDFHTDIVVHSNEFRDFGPNVRVVVPPPSDNHWSLQFAHKELFAESAQSYDLFIYSEDDSGLTKANIDAFLRLTPELAPDEIAGYLRYELDDTGQKWFPEMHGSFHWKPESAVRRGQHVVAEFSNEHAAFYILNRNQLKSAIASGGFLRGPREGWYDAPCTAATDPYTSCGFRKVIPITSLEDFLDSPYAQSLYWASWDSAYHGQGAGRYAHSNC